MSDIIYRVDSPKNFSHEEIDSFLELLVLQNKVQNPSQGKIYSCNKLGLAVDGQKIVAIAAIKPKTTLDFLPNKADLISQSDKFDWELGYCYTVVGYTGRGYCSNLVGKLMAEVYSENMIASTETAPNNSMVSILERNGFVQVGKKWLSQIHGGELALYFRTIE